LTIYILKVNTTNGVKACASRPVSEWWRTSPDEWQRMGDVSWVDGDWDANLHGWAGIKIRRHKAKRARARDAKKYYKQRNVAVPYMP
jgi:hypothetical protein